MSLGRGWLMVRGRPQKGIRLHTSPPISSSCFSITCNCHKRNADEHFPLRLTFTTVHTILFSLNNEFRLSSASPLSLQFAPLLKQKTLNLHPNERHSTRYRCVHLGSSAASKPITVGVPVEKLRLNRKATGSRPKLWVENHCCKARSPAPRQY